MDDRKAKRGSRDEGTLQPWQRVLIIDVDPDGEMNGRPTVRQSGGSDDRTPDQPFADSH